MPEIYLLVQFFWGTALGRFSQFFFFNFSWLFNHGGRHFYPPTPPPPTTTMNFIIKKLILISFVIIYQKNIRAKKVTLKFEILGSANENIVVGVICRKLRPKHIQFLKQLKNVLNEIRQKKQFFLVSLN